MDCFQIAGHLKAGPDKTDLKALALYSKQLNASAYRALWRSISIEFCIARDLRSASLEKEGRWHHSLPEPPDFATWPKRQRCRHPLARLVNIASRPHIVRHVKKLKLCSGSADRLLLKFCLNDEDNAAACAAKRAHDNDSPIIQRHTELVVRILGLVLPKLRSLETVRMHTNYSLYQNQVDGAAKMVLEHFSHPSRQGRLRSWHRISQVTSDLKMYSEISTLEQAFCNLQELVLRFHGHYVDLSDPGPSDSLLVAVLQRAKIRRCEMSLG